MPINTQMLPMFTDMLTVVIANLSFYWIYSNVFGLLLDIFQCYTNNHLIFLYIAQYKNFQLNNNKYIIIIKDPLNTSRKVYILPI